MRRIRKIVPGQMSLFESSDVNSNDVAAVEELSFFFLSFCRDRHSKNFLQ